MNLGVTGTREGMTPDQIFRFIAWMRDLDDATSTKRVLHHGDCVGADRDAWAIALSLGWSTCSHPATTAARWHANTMNHRVHTRRPALERNRLIVDGCDVLLAFPKQFCEVAEGGTWYTVRYARAVGRRIVVVWPDGTLSVEAGL